MKNFYRYSVAFAVVCAIAGCGATVPQLATDAQTLATALSNEVGPIASATGIPAATQAKISSDLALISLAAGSIAASPSSASASAAFVSAVEDLAPAVLAITGASADVKQLVAAAEALLPEFEAVAGVTSTNAPNAEPAMTQAAARVVIARYAHR